MQSLKRALIVLFITCLTFGASPAAAFAQTSACTDTTAGKSQAELQADLAACNQEIAQWTNILNNTKQQSASYQRDVAALTAKINAAQANIKAKNIAITNLSKNIEQKVQTITILTDKLEQGKRSLEEILRKTDQLDSYSLAEAMLSDKDMSEFFVDVNTYVSTEKSMEDLFNQIRGTRTATEQAKAQLDEQKQAQEAARALIAEKKKEVESDQMQKKQMLADSQSKERTYASVLAERQAKAAQIRAALFSLRDTASIQFGTALQYAQDVSAATGVRPAFLLAIITQESNLGQNVGACYLTNDITGDGIGANTGTPKPRVMSPTRDVPIFLNIASATGHDPHSTRVSCWQPIYGSSGNPIGWGGAMGPAQFIPSTWKLFSPRISTAAGSANPNPWNARDAFFAAGLYLKDLGAGTGNYLDEKNAACRYYSGSKCSSTSYGNSYGSQVMAKASSIQTTMIDPLQNL